MYQITSIDFLLQFCLMISHSILLFIWRHLPYLYHLNMSCFSGPTAPVEWRVAARAQTMISVCQTPQSRTRKTTPPASPPTPWTAPAPSTPTLPVPWSTNLSCTMMLLMIYLLHPVSMTVVMYHLHHHHHHHHHRLQHQSARGRVIRMMGVFLVRREQGRARLDPMSCVVRCVSTAPGWRSTSPRTWTPTPAREDTPAISVVKHSSGATAWGDTRELIRKITSSPAVIVLKHSQGRITWRSTRSFMTLTTPSPTRVPSAESSSRTRRLWLDTWRLTALTSPISVTLVILPSLARPV